MASRRKLVSIFWCCQGWNPLRAWNPADMHVRDRLDDVLLEQNCSFYYINVGSYIEILISKLDIRRGGFSLPSILPQHLML